MSGRGSGYLSHFYGQGMTMVTYGRQLIDDSDIAAVVAALQGEYLTTGPLVEKFERHLAEVTGAKHVIACSNGTTALHLACLALGVTQGDVGITSPITFMASANCIEMCGGRADFVDIDQHTCLDPSRLEDYCRRNPAPKVVIPVDFAGVPARLEEICFLSQRYGFATIEDAAHSLGSSYSLGSKTIAAAACVHTDLATLSFHPVKNITTAEGGAVTTNNDRLAQRLRLLRAHGIERNPEQMHHYEGGWYHEMHDLGYNYRISDIQCALGLSQLGKLDTFKSRRREIVERYNQAFGEHEEVVRLSVPNSSDPCFHLYPLRFRGGPAQRRFVYDYLKERQILAQVHYIPVHLQPYYRQKYGFAPGYCPQSELFYGGCLSLPLHCLLKDHEIEEIISSVEMALEAFSGC